MALTFTSNDVIGNAPGGPEGCFGKPAGPPSDDFKRQISDASTVAPDTPMYGSASPDSVTTGFLPLGSMSPMMRYDLPDCELAETSSVSSDHSAKEPEMAFLAKAGGGPFQMPVVSALFSHPPADTTHFGDDVDEEEDVGRHAEDDSAEHVQKDGITWLVARGRPPTMEQLEDKLEEVKSLYQAKFGKDVDEEDEEDEEEEEGKHADADGTEHVKKDGITWLVARGRPPTMEQLEDKLAEVKSLYQARFGEDVDEEEEVGEHADDDSTDHVEKDGITWLVARGRPPTMEQLEDRLAEVKSLYHAKCGQDLDDDEDDDEEGTHADDDSTEHVKKDGITWLVARGRPPTMSQLEDKLEEVKSLYKAKCGQDLDEEEDDDEEEEGKHADDDSTDHVEKDGITWIVARGRPPTMEQLEDRLAEVKSLYHAKGGQDLDEEDDDEEGTHADEDSTEHVKKDGITWLVARGRPPTMEQLEDRLAEVKSLYQAKCGQDLDEDEDDDEEGTHADDDSTDHVKKDGITWLVARGRPPTMSHLEDRLAEVKSLYKAKCGQDLDEEDEEDEEEVVGKHSDEDSTEHVKKDGITWLVARGRPPTLTQLEDRLAEVKSLYKAKFGQDLDEEEDEEEVLGRHADEDVVACVEKNGIMWLVVRGHRPTMSQLEQAKFGERVDEDDEVGKHADEDPVECVEKKGIMWLVARGRPPTMSQLEDRLAEVKSLYRAKFQGDVDEDEEVGTNVDEDGIGCAKKARVTWVVARGRTPTLSQLEDRLAEVKSLYKAKLGQDLDDEEDEEEEGNHAEDDSNEHVKKDGITWLVARGRPPTASQLEDRLAEVKSLYKAKFGEDVDEEEDEEEVGKHAEDDSAEHVDEDGVTWVVARGRPPTMPRLEEKLAEVKSLYAAKFGRSVDDDDDEDGV